jgi:predicted nuclease with TOPRIM domain
VAVIYVIVLSAYDCAVVSVVSLVVGTVDYGSKMGISLYVIVPAPSYEVVAEMVRSSDVIAVASDYGAVAPVIYLVFVTVNNAGVV